MTNRRTALKAAVAGAAASLPTLTRAADPPTVKGNVKHSVVFWCFNAAGEKWDADTTCKHAKDLGCVSVELIDPEHWPTLKKYGLKCAIAGNGYPKAGFKYGLNNPRHAPAVVDSTKKRIDECADFGCPSVIAFTGYAWPDPENPKSGEITREEGAKNCVAALKELAGHAEKKGVTVCVEHLNTRDSSHPMKGHPGYQGDDLDYLSGILRKVGSPRVKLLFDVYHVQIMHGDLLRRIDQNKDVLGHVHTAGNPGRGELDENQEIAYPAVMRKLLEIKYDGFVGHEFIPTRNPKEGLAQAVKVCDV
jgi:hydroxypyruvate isomerase